MCVSYASYRESRLKISDRNIFVSQLLYVAHFGKFACVVDAVYC